MKGKGLNTIGSTYCFADVKVFNTRYGNNITCFCGICFRSAQTRKVVKTGNLYVSSAAVSLTENDGLTCLD